MRKRLCVGAMLLTLTATCAMPVHQVPVASATSPPSVEVVPPPLPLPLPVPAPAEPFGFDAPPRQGAVLRGVAPPGAVALDLDGRAVPLAADGRFVIGFDRDAPNAAVLTVVRADGARTPHYLAVAPGNWRIEHVDASPTGGATSAQFQERRAGELARINAARAVPVVSDGWRQRFIWPVRARISGLFGAQRIYRGTPGSYHSGLDLAGGAGTPFVAPADGVVTLAAREPFTLEGHLLLLDHGMGLSSAFLHCARLDVAEGDVVRQGQVLGTIGATGRASGPHLHWGMKWGAARVDPLALMQRAGARP